MKKRERAKRKDNIIYFPGLEKQLTEKGLESLRLKKYAEAITLLEEAKDLDPENDEMLIGLVLAYFEASAYKKAKKLANEMLLKGIGDYFQMVDLYLTILIQLHEYPEIVSTIEALLDEKEIPPDKHDHFITILQFSRRMAEQNETGSTESIPEESNIKELNLYSLHNLNDQMQLAATLADKNIRPFVPEIKDYLMADSGNPFLKTVLLTLLKEQEYDKEIEIRKFNQGITVVPIQLPEVKQEPRMTGIKKILEEQLEQHDPVLFENIIGMVERIFFTSYPFHLGPEELEAWAGAFHFIAFEYLGMELNLNEISFEYQTSLEKIHQAIVQIREIEEISYPNI